jgi:hypothetical protein
MLCWKGNNSGSDPNGPDPGACRTQVIVASMVGEREQSFTISRRIVILRNEKSGE